MLYDVHCHLHAEVFEAAWLEEGKALSRHLAMSGADECGRVIGGMAWYRRW